jgi:hypothetical protein
MMNKMKPKEKILSELDIIQENGIRADRKKMKRNMHTQFADPFEFAREYVVNSYDAMASECYISGRETKESVTVTIRDNGRGMNHERLQDYFKIFCSRKDNTEINPIGRFGVGKMSVAAVPGLISFAGITSTGTECWRFETKTLIDDCPVKLERIEPVSPMGTKFEITLAKTMTLSELLLKIYEILYKYVRHLKIDVFFDLPELDEDQNPIRRKLTSGIWDFGSKFLGREYHIYNNGIPVEVAMGIGNNQQELYQNKVFITSKYNLLSFDLGEDIVMPNLMIRINSNVFELTFGRHCLSNESILIPIVKELRERVLPLYFKYLTTCINEDLILNSPEIVEKIDEMVVSLLALNPSNRAWSTFPLFKVHGCSRISFQTLSENILRDELAYIEASQNEGIDYSMFNALVLKQQQPENSLELIQKIFGQKIINLDLTDTVIEIQKSHEIEFSTEELEFARHLVFQSEQAVIDRILNSRGKNSGHNSGKYLEKKEELENSIGICEEARIVERDFTALIWKVNYLVERDGKTSCYSRKFMISGKKIILNLYHPEIRQFVELSSVNAPLAAHWAMAMCLSDPKLMPHITPEAREDVLLIDAMSRISLDGDFFENQEFHIAKRPFLDFLRNCINKD